MNKIISTKIYRSRELTTVRNLQLTQKQLIQIFLKNQTHILHKRLFYFNQNRIILLFSRPMRDSIFIVSNTNSTNLISLLAT